MHEQTNRRQQEQELAAWEEQIKREQDRQQRESQAQEREHDKKLRAEEKERDKKLKKEEQAKKAKIAAYRAILSQFGLLQNHAKTGNLTVRILRWKTDIIVEMLDRVRLSRYCDPELHEPLETAVTYLAKSSHEKSRRVASDEIAQAFQIAAEVDKMTR